MIKFVMIVGNILNYANAVYFSDYEDRTQVKPLTTEDNEYSPVNTLSKDNEKIVATKNINCDDFSKYVHSCTSEAALMYNSSRKMPPMPKQIPEWCSAMRHLTNCASDWNADCKDVTESHFYEESIKGHLHVVNNVCDDSWFLSRYNLLPECIKSTEVSWEKCYTKFNDIVKDKTNTSDEWTHYEIHFYLCCARAQFRRCTLKSLFETPNNCTNIQSVILQKFSVIVSEGDVYQDCDVNVMYTNCPDGDPRPNDVLLSKLVMEEVIENRSTKLITTLNFVAFRAFIQIISRFYL